MNCRLKIHNLYDSLIWFLLVWCVFQDFFLCIFFRVTGIKTLTKLMFYSKDIILVVLFVVAINKIKINKKILICYLIYFLLVIESTIIGLNNFLYSFNFTSFLSAIRGIVLLPVLTIIGYSVRNKNKFIQNIKKYYRFLVIVAAIGILEFVLDNLVGTKIFWMDFLRLDDFYQAIKGASAGLENGTPGNWYTDIGMGYRTQKRLISIWAAPLTAGFVILLPCLFYSISFFKNYKLFRTKITKKYMSALNSSVICLAALILTFTRQVLLPALVIIFISFIYYQKKNRKIIVVGSIFFGAISVLLMFESINAYIFNGSTMVHIIRLEEAISKISFLGSGIGSFGTRFAGAIATESQYLTLMGQLGVLSIIPYLVILVYPILYCRNKAKRFEGEEKIMICSLCFSGLCVLFAGMLSETVGSFTSIAQYYVLIGFAWGYCKEYGVKKL